MTPDVPDGFFQGLNEAHCRIRRILFEVIHYRISNVFLCLCASKNRLARCHALR